MKMEFMRVKLREEDWGNSMLMCKTEETQFSKSASFDL